MRSTLPRLAACSVIAAVVLLPGMGEDGWEAEHSRTFTFTRALHTPICRMKTLPVKDMKTLPVNTRIRCPLGPGEAHFWVPVFTVPFDPRNRWARREPVALTLTASAPQLFRDLVARSFCVSRFTVNKKSPGFRLLAG